jgi:hypothetical protein
MLGFEAAKTGDVQSLRNWLNANPCLSWEESDYLEHTDDLLALSHNEDNAASKLESWIERGIAQCFRKCGKVRIHSYPSCTHLPSTQSLATRSKSRDPRVHIFSTTLIRGLARVSIVLIIFVLLSSSILICYSIVGTKGRLATIIVSLMVLLALLSGFTTARTNELFLAAATYIIAAPYFEPAAYWLYRFATVLIVFISNVSPDVSLEVPKQLEVA